MALNELAKLDRAADERTPTSEEKLKSFDLQLELKQIALVEEIS